ncbi:hypothetical protein Leryth_005278 [Lithospermum erythrorhizon]|nr:hypothetical protein Leryth_005278 [Lithospermum erythrorhizon]
MPSHSMKKMLTTLFMKSAKGCGCRRSTDIIVPKQKSKFTKNKTSNPTPATNPPDNKCPSYLSDDQEWENNSTTPLSNNIETITSTTRCWNQEMVNCSSSLKVSDSIAVFKDSNDPYQDFRQSMLQMIIENEIHGKDELQELLKCFLQLNSPCHHKTIIKAFKDNWNDAIYIK